MEKTIKKGTPLEFHASRIIHGNPVQGTFVSMSDEWITVKLTKNISGLVNEWHEGDEKAFRKSLIVGTIKLL